MAKKGRGPSTDGGNEPQVEVFRPSDEPQVEASPKTGQAEIQEFEVERVERVYRCASPRLLSRMSRLHGVSGNSTCASFRRSGSCTSSALPSAPTSALPRL